MKIVSASFITLFLLASGCTEPQPRPIRPSIDPAPNTQDGQPPSQPQRGTTQGDSTSGGTTPGGTTSGGATSGGNVPPASPACPTNSTCKTFTAKETALCKLYGGGDTVCNSNQWNTEFYTAISSAISQGRTACTLNTGMNLRKEAAFAENIIEEIPSGTIIEKISATTTLCKASTSSMFYSVKWGTKTGFVCSNELTCL